MSFDTLAPHYRWMEWLLAGGKIQRCRTAFLGETKQACRALLVGEGNGRFLSELLRANSSVQVTYVDASARMLEQARARLQRDGRSAERVDFIHADILSWSPPRDGFDLLVTHFFLDCFRPHQLAEVVARLSAVAAPDARWLVSDFREPDGGLAQWRAHWILTVMYWFFRIVTRLPARQLTPPDPFLEQQGFVLQSRRLSEWGLLHSDLWVRGNDRAERKAYVTEDLVRSAKIGKNNLRASTHFPAAVALRRLASRKSVRVSSRLRR
jgi:ubiquinone/menaquinone biosynthesis C-methylase UbiE